MKKGIQLGVAVLCGCAVVFLAAGIYAGTRVADEFNLKPQLKEGKYTDRVVPFTHKKHAEEYAESCGDCHHDESGEPLALKAGDDVQKCIECHTKPGERPKGKDAPRLSKEERLEYHAEAFHYNCKDCHKAYNQENNTKDAPVFCSKCHVKQE